MFGENTNYEAPHYAVFSSFMFRALRSVQTFTQKSTCCRYMGLTLSYQSVYKDGGTLRNGFAHVILSALCNGVARHRVRAAPLI
jgi:hypothetical protein